MLDKSLQERRGVFFGDEEILSSTRRLTTKTKVFVRVVAILLVVCITTCASEILYEEESFDDPYSYYIDPVTVVGLLDSSDALAIWTDEWGPMVFLVGEKPVTFQKRVKTLHRGYLPIVECSDTRDGIAYSIQAFANTLSGKPEDKLIMFVKFSAKNQTNKKKKAHLWAGTHYNPRDINPEQTYSMGNGTALEDGNVLYIYDEAAISRKYTTPDVPYDGPKTARDVLAIPFSTVMNLVRFDWDLAPGEEKAATLKVPAKPFKFSRKTKQFSEQVKKADYEDTFNSTVNFWEGILAQGTQFYIPEKKTINTLRTALLHLLLSRNKVGDDYFQYVNRAQYPETWFRDGISTMHSYDVHGLPVIALQNIRQIQNTVWFGPREVVKADKIPSRYARKWGINPDPWDRSDLLKYGMKLWTYGEHFLLTGDKQFAEELMAEISGIIKWMDWVTLDDEFNLIPACSLYDAEWVVNAHRPGDNFWALAGLRAVRRMGGQLGNKNLIEQATKVIDRLQPALLKAVDKVMTEAGYVPGSFERNRVSRVHRKHQVHDGWGEDRDNQLMVWPSGALAPDHPAVEATSKKLRSRYEEGVSGFYGDKPGATFQYRGIWLMQQELARGEQELVVKDLYAILAHTGSTHGGYEVAWKSRWGMETHGWFWSRYIALIRNMFVREDWDGQLHILSTVPPDWAEVGNKIGIKNAPTHYGNFSLIETIRKDGADIEINAEYRSAPKSLILHLPYFAEVSRVIADGKEEKIEGESVSLPVDTKKVQLYWETKPEAMAFTYDSYLRDFWKTLKPTRIPIRYFYSTQERRDLVVKKDWRIIGPFDTENKAGFDAVFPPEKEINLNAQYQGKDGKLVGWQKQALLPVGLVPRRVIREVSYRNVRAPRKQIKEIYAGVDFGTSLGEDSDTNQGTAYAYTNIFSPRKQRVELLLGSAGPVKVWVNNVKVHENNIERRLTPDRDKFEVELIRGPNPVLIKVYQDGGKWAFSLRVTDMKGNAIEDLILNPETQPMD